MALDRVLHGNQPCRTVEQVMAERQAVEQQRRILLCSTVLADVPTDELEELARMRPQSRLWELAITANAVAWEMGSKR